MSDIVNIFDIDGCIIESCFPNLTDPQDREKVIREVLEFSKNISLFPAFLEYYEIFCKNTFSFFITGRQESEFKQLTQNQLYILKGINPHFIIVYYPENKSHNPEEYFTWKINSIKLNLNNTKVKYLIFDDLDDYFNDIKKYCQRTNLYSWFYKINSNDGWLELIL